MHFSTKILTHYSEWYSFLNTVLYSDAYYRYKSFKVSPSVRHSYLLFWCIIRVSSSVNITRWLSRKRRKKAKTTKPKSIRVQLSTKTTTSKIRETYKRILTREHRQISFNSRNILQTEIVTVILPTAQKRRLKKATIKRNMTSVRTPR